MVEWFTVFLVLPIFSLLAFSLLPSRVANAYTQQIRMLVTALLGIEFAMAVAVAIGFLLAGGRPQTISLFEAISPQTLSFNFYLDGASTLMLMLVSFVGFVVCRYSIRYLDGEQNQGLYFSRLALTLGTVSLMIVAGNLLVFFAAWVMTSAGLHHLLLHYPDRPAAHRAAWTKFAISRLGDAFLVAALVITYATFGSFDLASLFASVTEPAITQNFSAALSAIGWLLILGAATKSAQFPFHIWLPDTLETPTPVSALMHAGIVNAGGYLVIRMSPLIVHAPAALITLAGIGLITACFAGVVMTTQTSIKKSLAWSTIAQMGFMMLQCGLGAFSAAMVHILAHSLYKAHAFLSSGSVVYQTQTVRGSASSRVNGWRPLGFAFAAVSLGMASIYGISTLIGFGPATKPGGPVLMFVLAMSLTIWCWRLFTLGERSTVALGVFGSLGLALFYYLNYLAVDTMMAPPTVTGIVPVATLWMTSGIAVAFAALFTLHQLAASRSQPSWLHALHVHASNGFYIDSLYRRFIVPLAHS